MSNKILLTDNGVPGKYACVIRPKLQNIHELCHGRALVHCVLATAFACHIDPLFPYSEDLNSYSEACIQLPDNRVLDLRLFPIFRRALSSFKTGPDNQLTS